MNLKKNIFWGNSIKSCNRSIHRSIIQTLLWWNCIWNYFNIQEWFKNSIGYSNLKKLKFLQIFRFVCFYSVIIFFKTFTFITKVIFFIYFSFLNLSLKLFGILLYFFKKWFYILIKNKFFLLFYFWQFLSHVLPNYWKVFLLYFSQSYLLSSQKKKLNS